MPYERWRTDSGRFVTQAVFAGLLAHYGTEVSMKSMIAMAIGSVSAFVSGVAFAQNGNMMNGGSMWGAGWMGGYGGYWVPILLVVVVGLVVWAVLQKRK